MKTKTPVPLNINLVLWLAGRNPKNLAVEEARNIGPAIGKELRAIGIKSMADLLNYPFETLVRRHTAKYPNRIHIMCGYALYGAQHGKDCRNLAEDEKQRIKVLYGSLREIQNKVTSALTSSE